MKTKLSSSWLAGGLALALPWLNGCAQEAASAPGGSPTNAAPAPAVVATNPPVLSEAVATNFPVPPEPPADASAKPVVPDPEAAEARPLPPGLLASPSFSEVVRMANAGVDARVMMSFITNSAGTFNLGADQIIFLKDIGLSHEVIATMIEHDLAISSGKFQVTASTVPSRAALATAPPPQTAGTPPVSTAVVEPSVWQAQTPDPNAAANQYAPAPANAPAPPAGQSAETAPAAPQPTTVVNNNYFQQTLSPYGNWVNVEGYGNVWQPTVSVVDTTWRPYMNGGRWLYTDAGWYWNSDYAWGCTFQYGRWFYQPTYGWCWWPNTVWAPSWVTWRSSASYCGWAPLPPYSGWTAGVGFTWYGSGVSVGFGFNYGCNYYNWVPYSGVCSATPYRYGVPHGRATAIYNQSTVVNNVIVGNNNTIINRGVDVDRVSRYAGKPVPRASIRDVPHTASTGGRGDRVQRNGSEVVIERPSNAAARGPLAPSRQATPHLTSTTSRTPPAVSDPARATSRTEAPSVSARSGAPRQPSPTQVQTAPRQPALATTPAPSRSTPPGSVARAPVARGVATPPQAVPATRTPSQFAPVNPTPPSASPRSVAPAPRPSYTAPRVAMNPTAPVARPSYTPSTPSAPRSSYTGPTGAMNPTAPAPRPSYTPPAAAAPRPSYTPPSAPAPRPSYTPPPAPVMRAPTPAPSAPAPSYRANPSPAPSAPSAPSSGGSGGRGSRSPNDR